MRIIALKKLLLFTLLLPLQISVAEPNEPIRIGAVLMLTGGQAVYGKALLEGIQLGLDEANASGKTKFSLIVEDSQLKPQTAHTAATKLVKIDRVAAALNASFIESMANGKVFETAQVPVITLWDSASEIERIGDYIFGIGLWTPSSATRASDFAIQDLKARTAAIINTQAEWSETVADLFEKNFSAYGGEVLKRVSVTPAETDFRTSVHLVKSLKPDVLYAPLTENLIPFYRQLREAGFDKPIITSDIVAAEHIEQAPELFEGVYQTNAPDPSGEIASELMKRYKQKFGVEPRLPLFVCWGYDGIRLLVSGLTSAGNDPIKLKSYLYQVKDFRGASATISFSPEGSSPVMEKMYVIRRGKFELVDVDNGRITNRGPDLRSRRLKHYHSGRN